jgi:hypothetical protein
MTMPPFFLRRDVLHPPRRLPIVVVMPACGRSRPSRPAVGYIAVLPLVVVHLLSSGWDDDGPEDHGVFSTVARAMAAADGDVTWSAPGGDRTLIGGCHDFTGRPWWIEEFEVDRMGGESRLSNRRDRVSGE